MAYFESFSQFDINAVNLYWYSANLDESGLEDNSYQDVNGQVYEDLFYVDGYDGYDWLELLFLGSGFEQDLTGAIVAGTVNFVGEYDFFADSIRWYAEGISASAVAIYSAALTPSNQDEIAIIEAALSGDDTIILSPFDDRMYGFDGDDDIYGYAGNDTLYGGDGDDFLTGGAGNDTLNGGVGSDQAWYDDAAAGVTANLETGTAKSTLGDAAGIGLDTLISIEHVVGGDFADTLTGNASSNFLDGNDGNDWIAGRDGADWLFGYDGDDQLFGEGGADELYGEGGNDQLDGGAAGDKMSGGAGNDTYYVGDASDQVIEGTGAGSDTVLSTISFVLGANVEKLQLLGSASINATGNSLANVLIGNSGNNVLDGGAGGDRMEGGAGNDTYYVGNAFDQIIENASSGSDTVYSSITYALGENLENLRLLGSAAINGTGSARNNVLTGNSGSNVLDGGAGADRLSGGAGNDTLWGGKGTDQLSGGSGADVFAFGSGHFGGFTAATSERILDFNHAEGDLINLNQIDANSLMDGDQSFTFIGNQSFHNVAGELRFVQSASYTYVYGDTNGDGTADFLILLDGGRSMIGGDFIL